jgi:hypothetical protein
MDPDTDPSALKQVRIHNSGKTYVKTKMSSPTICSYDELVLHVLMNNQEVMHSLVPKDGPCYTPK